MPTPAPEVEVLARFGRALADDSVDAVFAHVLLRLAGDLSGPAGPGAAAGRISRAPGPVLLRRPVSSSG
ncbi:hypothetical protein OU787_32220 [Kitasatospora sp. YST-16]|uniref:hypothetical protein n=1 Tax=Kitasatospora sp. YST-16 TaxID=2998080 RepID=UPI0022849858|nr:hypothetical protein [Kitasatospora sp. YST-16]WAL75799.1 hypothetical protein OU787_32220 [Kitasatospora sp. YST-16]